MDSLIHANLRHALRAVTRAKGTAAVLLTSLALGTGANAAVFGVLDALLLRGPAGVENPRRLANLYTSEFSGSPYGAWSYPDYESARGSASVFTSMAAIDDGTVDNVRIDEAGRAARIAQVTDDFFAALGMTPHAGRLTLQPDRERPAAIVSAQLAEEVGGSAGALGKALAIGDTTYSIVGVTPPRFRGLQVGRECDVWIPIASRSRSRGDRRFAVIARLRSGVTIDRAATELRRISDRLAGEHARTNRGSIHDPNAPRLMSIERFSNLDRGASAQTTLVGFVVAGASTLLLAAACFNVGGLLLSSSLARARELAIKMALGATRATLMRQLLIEAIALSLAGGALGLLFAVWTAEIIPALFMTEEAARLDLRLSARTIALTIGVAGAAGAAFGIAPALYGTASPAVTALRADAGGVGERERGSRLRRLIVTSQIAFSTMLLLVTGLLIASLGRALEGDLGATIKQIAVLSIDLPGQFGDPTRGIAVRTKLLQDVPKIGGVVRAGWSSTLPLGRGNRGVFEIEGSAADVRDKQEFDVAVVTPEYFDVLAMQPIEGRLFDYGDSALATPVIVVDELLARRHFGEHAIGSVMIDARGTRLEIVGVVPSGRYRTLQQPPQPTVYYPAMQEYLWRGHLIVRTSTDPALMFDVLRTGTSKAGGSLSIPQIMTLETRISESLALDRLTVTLVGACGVIALAMSTLGVYGIMNDAVRRRTREIGVRAALGAGPFQIARLIVLEAAYPAAGGLAIGALGALAAARVGRLLLHGAPPIDLTALAATAGALFAVIIVAAIVPLQRALRVHPSIALRAE
jgi:predicted permease